MIPGMLACIGGSLNRGDELAAQEGLEVLIEVAEAHPRFLRKQLVDVVQVRVGEGCEDRGVGQHGVWDSMGCGVGAGGADQCGRGVGAEVESLAGGAYLPSPVVTPALASSGRNREGSGDWSCPSFSHVLKWARHCSLVPCLDGQHTSPWVSRTHTYVRMGRPHGPLSLTAHTPTLCTHCIHAQAVLQIARAEQLDDATRQLAAEFLVTLCEAREKAPGMMRKLPNFVPSLFEMLMTFLMDVEDDPLWHSADTDQHEEAGAGVDAGGGGVAGREGGT
eukprot:280183-Chlamydomonas_euryale.AAC.1